MGLPYDPHELEARWRSWWDASGAHEPDLDTTDPANAFVNLAEFPYPSAEGLHVGHVFRYAGIDAHGRMLRMQGKVVLQPMGFDAFGIHAENFALKMGEHPAALTARTTANFRRQLDAIGAAWDWRAAVDTSDANYYRWTQWIFLRLFEAGLAYQAEAPVLWCPGCQTVLAREQVEDDRCERCRARVVERVMRQWFLRITAYADRLLDGLEALDWPERSKRLQRAWIGRADDGSHRLHDWLISRQRYWGPPIPVVHCATCGAVGVPDQDLPVRLPAVDDVAPPGDGRSPLAAVEEFVATVCPRCAGPAARETDVSDTFLDSTWYFLRYVSAGRDEGAWDTDRVRRWLPAGFYGGGPEHVQRHHLYARFVCMALHDLGLVPFAEPFPRIRLGGMIVHGGAKMSKSRGNVVSPDPYWEAHGRDVLRGALLFSAPWEKGGDFRDDAIAGIERFYGRVWRSVTRVVESASAPGEATAPDADERVADAVQAVSAAIERTRFNVAIARLMELQGRARSRPAVTTMVLLLAPLAPHLAEEMWSRLGGDGSVHDQPWPKVTSTVAGG